MMKKRKGGREEKRKKERKNEKERIMWLKGYWTESRFHKSVLITILLILLHKSKDLISH